MTSQQEAKKRAGYLAADRIQDGMSLGVGTGSTVFYFIERLNQRIELGLKVKGVFSSKKSESLSPRLDQISHFTHLDLVVDGADEITPEGFMIKGGGGALLREKVIASSATRVIIIVDSSKRVPHLGKAKLPIEVLPFGCEATASKFKALGFCGAFRLDPAGNRYLTDNQNYIFDLEGLFPILNPQEINQRLLDVVGVVETGLFFDLPLDLIIG